MALAWVPGVVSPNLVGRTLHKTLPLLLIQGFVLVTAYYQAKGINHLLTAFILTPSMLLEMGNSVSRVEPRQAATGEAPERAAPAKLGTPALSPHTVLPVCPEVELAIVSVAADPTASLVSLRSHPGERARVMQRGSRTATLEVLHIGYDPVSLSPAAWLEGTDGVCRALLFSHGATPQGEPPPAPVEAPGAIAASGAVERVGAGEFIVERSFVEELLEAGDSLATSLRSVPEKQQGRVVGIRLFGIREGSWPSRIGLENGDRLEMINGYSLTSPATLIEAYARLRHAEELRVEIFRRGVKQTLHYEIR